MNTVEGILLEIGEGLVAEHDGSKPLLIYLNIVLKEVLTEPILDDESGFVVLALIYTLEDTKRQDLVLSKIIKFNVNRYERYTFTLTIMTMIIVSIVLFMATNGILVDDPLDAGTLDVLKMILYNLFEIVKHILDIDYPVSS